MSLRSPWLPKPAHPRWSALAALAATGGAAATDSAGIAAVGTELADARGAVAAGPPTRPPRQPPAPPIPSLRARRPRPERRAWGGPSSARSALQTPPPCATSADGARLPHACEVRVAAGVKLVDLTDTDVRFWEVLLGLDYILHR